jgi:hypothetical protein
MKNETKRTAAWTRWAMRAVSALALAVLGTGCTPECVDAFDCRNKRTAPAGQTYTCREERCELIPVNGETPADAGTDGGSEPATDAGTDGGSEPPTDGGTDGGSEPPTDGGTDGGTVTACADRPHDAKLGTLRLEPGYEVAESADVPEGLLAVTAMPQGSDYALYALKRSDTSIYALGTWPSTVALGAQPLANVVAPEDRASEVFLNPYLVNDGTRLLAGYTKRGDNAPGSVLVFDTVKPENATYLPAPGNYSAAGLPDIFIFSGVGLEATTYDSAIYALQAGAKGTKLATFDPRLQAFSGPTAVTADGIAVLGYFPAEGFSNHLRAVAPAQYRPVLTEGRTPVDLSTAPEVYARADLFEVAGFGDSVALHRGTYDPKTRLAITQNVARIPLEVSALDPQVVTVGTLQNVLVAQDVCTQVMYMAPLGRDLLVGIFDSKGRRLVRVHKP